VRRYIPGDDAKQIDWNVTARLNELHVREVEAQTDRDTMLFFDQRHTMGDGPPGRTKLDYARQLALAYVQSAQHLNDPLGYRAIGDDGFLESFPTGTTLDQLNGIRRALLDSSPTAQTTDDAPVTDPATATRIATTLADDDSAFARTLEPYFAAQHSYVRNFERQPLYHAVESSRTVTGAPVSTVLITDDSHRVELRKTIQYLSQKSSEVTVYLSPSVLFRSERLTDVESGYDRYVDFESFRRTLDSVPNVSVYEFAPRDELSAVLEAGTASTRRRVQS
jgi:uncharacterized protein (DUF58 family)